MKSLLVDVLRQAKDGSPQQTLSDSGSFDTTQDDIDETANDAVAATQEDQADELKLFETSASLDASFDLSANEETAFEDLASGQLPVAGTGGHGIAAPAAARAQHESQTGTPPALARFTPVVCVVGAILAAVIWIAYQQLALSYSGSEVASAPTTAPGLDSGNTTAAAANANLQRFPFISPEAVAAAARESE